MVCSHQLSSFERRSLALSTQYLVLPVFNLIYRRVQRFDILESSLLVFVWVKSTASMAADLDEKRFALVRRLPDRIIKQLDDAVPSEHALLGKTRRQAVLRGGQIAAQIYNNSKAYPDTELLKADVRMGYVYCLVLFPISVFDASLREMVKSPSYRKMRYAARLA